MKRFNLHNNLPVNGPPTATKMVSRHIEIVASYHSMETHCHRCTLAQGKTIRNLLALHANPSDSINFLGTYGKPPAEASYFFQNRPLRWRKRLQLGAGTE